MEFNPVSVASIVESSGAGFTFVSDVLITSVDWLEERGDNGVVCVEEDAEERVSEGEIGGTGVEEERGEGGVEEERREVGVEEERGEGRIADEGVDETVTLFISCSLRRLSPSLLYFLASSFRVNASRLNGS